jgi:hypothetical protein
MCHITRTLNAIVEQDGEININNRTIWDTYLHQMDNTIWRGILQTLLEFYLQYPMLFELHQVSAINEALTTLNQYYDYYDNVLHINKPNMKHRRIAWRALMVIREVVNTAQGARGAVLRTNTFNDLVL